MNVPAIAYIANEFPSPVEPYVQDEIRELRRRGITVVASTARKPLSVSGNSVLPDLVLEQWGCVAVFRTFLLLVQSIPQLSDLLLRILFEGDESLARRVRCLLHTALGVYYAVRLRPFHVDHIHAHHGYFSSWVAMVAARLLNIGFSLTLHGSDLLLHPSFLDTKLVNCDFCVTVSEYNRNFLLNKFPEISRAKVLVQHLGVDIAEPAPASTRTVPPSCVVLLAVGRLHPIKNHAFLVDACARLRDSGTDIFCLIAGEGPERSSLEHQIASRGLDNCVTLLGHVPHVDLDPLYALADLVVLTSHSEGIPLVLMEAMMRGKAVLAPAITGIPELVEHGRTGFLYRAGSIEDFVSQLRNFQHTSASFDELRSAARAHVLAHFERQTNLEAYARLFLARLRKPVTPVYENPVLQQI